MNKDFVWKPVFIQRRLINNRQLWNWAQNYGIENLEDPFDFHMTVAYSKKPVNWLTISENLDKIYYKIHVLIIHFHRLEKIRKLV